MGGLRREGEERRGGMTYRSVRDSERGSEEMISSSESSESGECALA